MAPRKKEVPESALAAGISCIVFGALVIISRDDTYLGGRNLEVSLISKTSNVADIILKVPLVFALECISLYRDIL